MVRVNVVSNMFIYSYLILTRWYIFTFSKKIMIEIKVENGKIFDNDPFGG